MRLFQFKTILAFTLILSVSLTGYVGWTAWAEYQSSVAIESATLAKYASRLRSRLGSSSNLTSPVLFSMYGESGGDSRRPDDAEFSTMSFASSYPQFAAILNTVPNEADMSSNQFRVFNHRFSSLVKLPDYSLAIPVEAPSGEIYYAFRVVKQGGHNEYVLLEKVQPAISVTLICTFILVMTGVFHLSKINFNVREFERWANSLEAGKQIAPPDFTSSKLSYMAEAIGKSLNGISEALEKEQAFAKYTSHELRTPIAVLSANMEVLELIKKDMSPRERALLSNMDSAISDMKYQMEALLWLCNENVLELPVEYCSINVLAEKSLHDNTYLIEDKNVAVEVTGEELNTHTRPALVQIVLNNLVRNAFQNTVEGKVDVHTESHKLTIENTSRVLSHSDKPVGFGLGTVIIEKLVEKLGCDYIVEEKNGGRKVTLTF